MKLLLTSSGIANKSIAQALEKLSGVKPQDAKVAFVPTAANGESGEKNWLIADMLKLQNAGYAWIDIVDPSADGIDWRERLQNVDIIFIGGGNTFHLLDQARKTGFGAWLQENKDTKVLVGSSAGSIIMTPTISVAGGADANNVGLKNLDALGFTEFEFIPHVPSMITLEQVQTYAQIAHNTCYAVDDETAIMVDSSQDSLLMQVISEGDWRDFPRG